MPPRDPSLPEGTDHIIDTNIDLGDSGGAGGPGGGTSGSGGGGGSGASGGGASSQAGSGQAGGGTQGGNANQGGGDDASSAFKFDKDKDQGGDNAKSEGIAAGIAGQIKDQISGFTSQATDRVRSLADDGKSQATSFLQTIADVLSDAAGSIEDKLGEQYAGPGNSASESIRSLAGRLDDSSVEDLYAGAKSFVQKSPVLAIGVAAVAGFAVARVLRSSIAEFRGGGQDDAQGGGTSSGAGGASAA